MSYAFDYIKQNKLETNQNYPYEEVFYSCRAKSPKMRYGVKSYKKISPVSVKGLVKALDRMPVSVSIFANTRDFMLYQTGIFNPELN